MLTSSNASSLFLECFPLCLSRACLGEVIVFRIKMAQKWRFPYLTSSNVCKKTVLFCECFPYNMFVPSLSWQNDAHLYIQTGQKVPFSYLVHYYASQPGPDAP
eukprot:SAG22_NODE_102_length_20195_cov_3.248308_7_plen_103_part_00